MLLFGFERATVLKKGRLFNFIHIVVTKLSGEMNGEHYFRSERAMKKGDHFNNI